MRDVDSLSRSALSLDRRPALAAQGRGAQAPAAPPTPRAQAPLDLTGYWVAIISEDWRWRMITPSRGDFPSIPINAGRAEDCRRAGTRPRTRPPAKQCKAYGAPGLMRGPTRLRITWLDDDTLKLETRLRHADAAVRVPRRAARRRRHRLQGRSVAQWIVGGGRPRPRRHALRLDEVGDDAICGPATCARTASRTATNTVFTEYWDVHTEANGDRYLVITNMVDDPTYLQAPWITANHFKREAGRQQVEPRALRCEILMVEAHEHS